MTFKYKDVYIKETATVSGPYEKEGPLGEYFDKSYEDLYFGKSSWELAEQKLVEEVIDILLNKLKIKGDNIELVLAGDLSNQITSTTFGSKEIGKSFLGVYDACATSGEELIIASNMIDTKKIKNALCITSSHNMVSEKQFRNPTEYGAPKPQSATFTATGAAACFLTSEKTSIKIESSTIGKLIDCNQKDPNYMGGAMSAAAAYTINKHLKDLKRKPEYYDLILTGDLGKYGKNILIQYLNEEYKLDISRNYNDSGVMLYDLDKQEECLAGGSGPVCSCLVNYSYIYKKLKEKEIKKVLLVPTGAMYSPSTLFQGQNILSIAHAISLEVV